MNRRQCKKRFKKDQKFREWLIKQWSTSPNFKPLMIDIELSEEEMKQLDELIENYKEIWDLTSIG